jgi:putative PIN family toxin of toxin-antitoxin system
MSEPRGLASAVVDTNLFISGLISKVGLPYQLTETFRQGSFTLLISPQLRAELEEVLRRDKFRIRYRVSDAEREQFLSLLHTQAVPVTPRRRLPIAVRDPKDERVLAAALGGRADYLITGDEGLLVLNGDPRIGSLRIVTVRQFLELLEARKP